MRASFPYRVVLALLLCLAAGAVLAAVPPATTRDLELMVSDDPRAALKRATQWLTEARAKQDRASELQALRLSAKANEQMEELPQLRQDIAAGLVLARNLGHSEAVVEFLTLRARAAVNEGNYAEASRLFDETLAEAVALQLPANHAKAQVSKAHLLLQQNRMSEALALLIEAHAYFERVQDTLWMSNTLALMASTFGSDPGDKEGKAKAVSYNLRALALMDPKRNRYDMATDYHNLGVDYAGMGDFAKAREYFVKSMALARELDDRVSIAYLDYRLGQLDREDKAFAKALAAFDRAMPVFAEVDNSVMLLHASLARARTLAALERRREALDALARARPLAAKVNTPYTDSSMHEAAMDIYRQFGDFERALKEAQLLREAEQRASRAAKAEQAAELEERFDSRQKEVENALLRSRQQASDVRRIALGLALILALSALGGLAYFVVRQAQKNRRFETLAMRDDLTDLPNRRSILEFARLQLNRRRESDQGFCLALIDIDHFKAINDEFGHALGDAVLVAFAAACQGELRANDRLGRFGGEEFLLVMPGSGEAQVPAVFERLRAAVQRVEVAGLPVQRKLTFSLGAAIRKTPADGVDDLINRADRALYRAKEGGRDRFEVG